VANIRACFSDRDAAQQESLIKEALVANVFGLIETAHAWVRGVDGLEIEMQGWENYEAAKKDGRGILVFSCHFSMLDMGAAIVGDKIPTGTIYRKHDNPLFNYYMTRSREKFVKYTVARKDIKGMIRRLKAGENLAYLPDQDFGRKRSIFVPFFGVPAATITMTSQLAEVGNAIVLPISAYRVGHTPKYILTIHPLMDIPTGDHVADTQTWVRWLEDRVREHPEQYLWFHKRFKTRPEGEPSVY
jgi:KDO2-lipid IV(A) lauroyltransferase